jgi:phasin family protein
MTKHTETAAQWTNPFGDLTTMFEQIKVPGVDMAAIIEARRKDIDTLFEANKAIYEGVRALANKQAEMLSHAVQSIQDGAKGAAGNTSTWDPTKHAELVRKACGKAMADMQDLAEIARKSQAVAMTAINERVTQHAQEIKKMMQPK